MTQSVSRARTFVRDCLSDLGRAELEIGLPPPPRPLREQAFELAVGTGAAHYTKQGALSVWPRAAELVSIST